MPPKKEAEHEEKLTLALKWGSFDSLPSLPANQFLISHLNHQYYLFFGEVTPPAVMNLDKEKDSLPKVLEVKPLAKIVIPEGFMERVASAIRDHLEKVQKEPHP